MSEIINQTAVSNVKFFFVTRKLRQPSVPLLSAHRRGATVAGPSVTASELGHIDAVLLTHDHHDDNLDLLRAGTAPVRSNRRHHRLGRETVRRRRPWARALGDDAARRAGATADRDHRDAVPSRPSTQPPIRRRRDRLRTPMGRPGSWRHMDLRRHRSLRRPPTSRGSSRRRHRPPSPWRRPLPGHWTPAVHDDRPRRRSAVPPRQPTHCHPFHYEGWKHFRQGREAIERDFARAPEDIRRRIQWLTIGAATTVSRRSRCTSATGTGSRCRADVTRADRSGGARSDTPRGARSRADRSAAVIASTTLASPTQDVPHSYGVVTIVGSVTRMNRGR
jgi:hypothetical protein